MAEDRRGGRGRVGAEIFDQVERLLAEEKLTRSEAFQRISEQTGRRAGTVAANYYRIARQRGAALRPRARRGEGRPRARSGRAGGGDAQAAVRGAMAAMEELTALVRKQEQELARLRDENARFDQVRKLLR